MKASLVLVEMVAVALLMLATVQVSGAAVHSSSALRAKRSTPEAYESTAAYQSVIQFMMDNGYTSPAQITVNNEAIKAFILTIDQTELEAFGVELAKTSNATLLKVLEKTKFRYGDSVGQLQYMLYIAAVMDALWSHTAPNNP